MKRMLQPWGQREDQEKGVSEGLRADGGDRKGQGAGRATENMERDREQR